MHEFEIGAAKERLADAGGGYEVIHESAGLELGVYVLMAPPAAHADDEVYVVLEAPVSWRRGACGAGS